MKENMFYGASPLIFERAKYLRNNLTKEEEIIWGFLKNNPLGYKFRRQHPLSIFIADFYCHKLKLVIEIDGTIHNVEENKIKDKERQNIIENLGIKVIRFTNEEVLKETKTIFDKINLLIVTMSNMNNESNKNTEELLNKETNTPLGVRGFLAKYANHPNYFAPVGNTLHAKNWQCEAAIRMLLNNLHHDVAENPAELVVYGGIGQAARNVESLQKIIEILLELDDDHSLLVQSGKPVGVVRTHKESPRVLIANSNLVPHWATWDHFNMLRNKGLMMYGQMTAGSWIYIGTQGIVQGTYETFAECANQHFGGTLKGKLLVTAGLGGMGGAQPLAATFAGATFLGIDIDPTRIQKRIDTKYIDKMTHSYEEAKTWMLDAKEKGEAISIGLVGDAGDVLEKLIADNIIPEVLTDQTSAHDPLYGYVPNGMTLEAALQLRKTNPKKYEELSIKAMARHVNLMLQMQQKGSIVFDYGNNIREFAKQGGVANAYDFPGFVPAYIRPLFCQGKGPFRWVALSGDPEDIYTTDKALLELFPENKMLHNWIEKASAKIAFQGLPARICWLGMGEREKAGLLFNELVRTGKVKSPIVIGRDHLDCGSVASPNRETEAMLDGTDAVSDWPLLNLMSNTAGGASWVSLHHGGGVGIGYSQHAGMVVVADGTDKAAAQLSRVLYNDPAMGVFRHSDAGYEIAKKTSKEFGLDL